VRSFMILFGGSIVGPQMPLAVGRYFLACIFRCYSASVFLGSFFGLVRFFFIFFSLKIRS
jgi:hypothetical protein